MTRRRDITLAATLLAASFCGCGGGGYRPRDGEVEVPLAKIPDAAMKAARAKLPDFELDKAWKVESEGGEDAWEIRGTRKDGKIRDLKVSASGKILEVD